MVEDAKIIFLGEFEELNEEMDRDDLELAKKLGYSVEK